MMVAVIVLLSVLVILEVVKVYIQLRPLLALARLLEAGQATAESAERIAGALAVRFAGD